MPSEIVIEQGDGLIIDTPNQDIVIDQGGETIIIGPEGDQILIDGPAEQIVVEGATIIEVGPAPDPFAISSFTTSPTVFEVGTPVVTPSFTASYSDTPDTAVLTDDEGSPSKDVSSTPTAFSSDGTFTKTANNDSVQFTLTADLGAEQDIANRSISWQPRTFWGIEAAGPLVEAEIEALAGNALDSNFARVFSVNAAGPTDYVWYCFPQSYDPGDAAQFQVGQFVGGFFKSGVVSVTNGNGVAQNYACWRSDFPQLGSITVTVS